jgi:hypothetical protein
MDSELIWMVAETPEPLDFDALSTSAAGDDLPPWWDGYLPDESGQSDAFLDTAGADWRFVTGFDRWHGWNGTHWAADETRRLRYDLGKLLDEVFEAKSAEARQMMKDAGAIDAQSDEGKEARPPAECNRQSLSGPAGRSS